VIVPTRNRPRAIAQCLASLANLEFPRDDFDVVVVNDGGDDDPALVVRELDAHLRVSVVTIGHAGPAAARNAGIAASRGESLAFIDDDCEADPAWLSAMARRLAGHPASVIGGRVVNSLDHNRYSRASQNLQDFLYRWYHEERRGSLRFFTSNNIAVSRSTLESIGDFDTYFPFASEDRDWCDRALLGGCDLVYAPEARTYHSHDLSFSSFLGQHFRYGQGARRFHTARGRRGAGRIRLEPADFYTGMLAAPFSQGLREPLIQSLLLIASQSALAVGFAHEAARSAISDGTGEGTELAPRNGAKLTGAGQITGTQEEMDWNRF
jgi:glycosyltransferase involved in cell wall biosynthesis